MTILFLHGLGSTVGGVKPTYLAQHGHTVLNPALPDDDFDEAVKIAQDEFDRHRPDVVVGSSRGGAAAMNIDSGSIPLVLLCPAWRRWGKATTVKPNTLILHSKADEVVPFADSVELIRNGHLPPESLIDVGTEHRLADEESLKKMLEAVERVSKAKTIAEKPKIRIDWRRLFAILLAVMVVYLAMFPFLWPSDRALPLTLVIFSLLLTSIGLAQKLLYQGQRPFRASMAMGAGFFLSIHIFYLVAVLFESHLLFNFPFAPVDPIEALMGGAVYGIVLGLPVALVIQLIDGTRHLWDRFKGRKVAASRSMKPATTIVLLLVVSGMTFSVLYVWQQWYIPRQGTVAAIEQRYGSQLKALADYAHDYEQTSKMDGPDGEKIKRLFGDITIVEASIDDNDGLNQIAIIPAKTSLIGTSCWFPRFPTIGKPVVNLYQGGCCRYIKYSNAVRDQNGKERSYTIVLDLSKMNEIDK
ncbi:MAG: hypothetical protein ABFC77_11935 [Thermoguttaceae bacterium]